MRSLLDVNVLLALLDQDHVHHDTAREWLLKNEKSGWASCPITENGFVRIISQPTYPGSISVRAAMDLLAATRVKPTHEFWPADLSILDTVAHDHVHGPKQLSDCYLLALAARHGGKFVTFDARVSTAAVPCATSENLLILGA